MWCILRIRPGPTANRTGDPSDPSDPASPFRLCFGSGLCTDQRTNERTNEIYWKQWQFRTEQETIDRRERETDALSVILRIHQWPISTKICCFVLLFGITRLVSSSLVFFFPLFRASINELPWQSVPIEGRCCSAPHIRIVSKYFFLLSAPDPYSWGGSLMTGNNRSVTTNLERLK